MSGVDDLLIRADTWGHHPASIQSLWPNEIVETVVGLAAEVRRLNAEIEELGRICGLLALTKEEER